VLNELKLQLPARGRVGAGHGPPPGSATTCRICMFNAQESLAVYSNRELDCNMFIIFNGGGSYTFVQREVEAIAYNVYNTH